jgi:hypothetical protein
VQKCRSSGVQNGLVAPKPHYSQDLSRPELLTPSEQFFFSPARCSTFRTRYETRLVAYLLDFHHMSLAET